MTVSAELLCRVAPMRSLKFHLTVLQFNIRLSLAANIRVIRLTTALILKYKINKANILYNINSYIIRLSGSSLILPLYIGLLSFLLSMMVWWWFVWDYIIHSSYILTYIHHILSLTLISCSACFVLLSDIFKVSFHHRD